MECRASFQTEGLGCVIPAHQLRCRQPRQLHTITDYKLEVMLIQCSPPFQLASLLQSNLYQGKKKMNYDPISQVAFLPSSFSIFGDSFRSEVVEGWMQRAAAAARKTPQCKEPF